jgi:hypothetical protein
VAGGPYAPGYAQTAPGYAPNAPGYAQTAPGYAPGYAQTAPGYAPVDPANAQLEAQWAEQAKTREAARNRFRVVLGGDLLILLSDLSDESRTQPGAGLGVHLGVRKHVGPKLGIEGSVGAFYGIVAVDKCSVGTDCTVTESHNSATATSLRTFYLEGALMVGPFGRFYFAPAVWVGQRQFADSSAHVGNATYYFKGPGIVGGLAGRVGLLLGNQDQFDVYIGARGDLMTDTSLCALGGGSIAF